MVWMHESEHLGLAHDSGRSRCGDVDEIVYGS